MRAFDTPTKKQKARLSQAVYQDSLDAMSDNLAATLIVLHEYFWFGEKRLRDFLEHTTTVVKAKAFLKENACLKNSQCLDA